MKKSRKLKIFIFAILFAIIVISNVILISMFMRPQVMFSPELGPSVQQSFVSFTFIIFGSIAVSLVILFVLFYFFVVKG